MLPIATVSPVALVQAPMDGWWEPLIPRPLSRLATVGEEQVLGFVRGFGEWFPIKAPMAGTLEWPHENLAGLRVAQGDLLARVHRVEQGTRGELGSGG